MERRELSRRSCAPPAGEGVEMVIAKEPSDRSNLQRRPQLTRYPIYGSLRADETGIPRSPFSGRGKGD